MANDRHPYAWVRDLTRVVNDQQMRDIVNDFRRGPAPPGPTLPSVRVMGAGTVVDGDSKPTAGNGSGWCDSPEIKNWRAPGIEHVDRLLDQADAIDKAERIRLGRPRLPRSNAR
jgi:hypothetical protein